MSNEALLEAVKIVMQEMVYEWKSQFSAPFWYKQGESYNTEQALVKCEDLNKLDDICEKHGWMLETQPSRANILKRVTEVYECWDYVGTAIIDGVEVKTRKEAALLATAEALKSRHNPGTNWARQDFIDG